MDLIFNFPIIYVNIDGQTIFWTNFMPKNTKMAAVCNALLPQLQSLKSFTKY